MDLCLVDLEETLGPLLLRTGLSLGRRRRSTTLSGALARRATPENALRSDGKGPECRPPTSSKTLRFTCLPSGPSGAGHLVLLVNSLTNKSIYHTCLAFT